MRPSILAVCGVDDQFELTCLHDRQLRRLRPLEDAADVNGDLTICIHNVAPVAHQPADLSEVAVRKYRGERVARCQVDQLDTPAVEKGVEAAKSASGARDKPCEGDV